MGTKHFIRVSGIRVASDEPTNEEFGRLVKIGRRFIIGRKTFTVAECNCGEVLAAYDNNINTGAIQSCGCLHRDRTSNANTTHGACGSPEYKAWKSMKARCMNPNNKSHADYSGRGITVCDRWLISFENFYADMGPQPSPRHSVEREENNGNYCPENCKWATRVEQANNRRGNHILEINGKSKTIAEWSRISLVSYETISSRLRLGWSHESAVFQPVRKPAKPTDA